jgi:hypothetical protein
MFSLNFNSIFFYIGLLWFCKLILWIFNNINSWYYHRESYKDPKELRYFLLKEENRLLKERIAILEEENHNITNSIIENFQIRK